MNNSISTGLSYPTDKGPYCLKEILYRILALIFLIAAIGAVFLIAEDANAANTYEAACEMYGYITAHVSHLK